VLHRQNGTAFAAYTRDVLFGLFNEGTVATVPRLWGPALLVCGALVVPGHALADDPKVDDDADEDTAPKPKGTGKPIAAKPDSAPMRPSDAPLPSCLDMTIRDQLGAQLRPRGVQKRDFAKNKKINLVAHGGLYGGDLTSSNWIAGGSLGFFFTEDLGLQLEFDLTPLTLDLDSPLNKFFGDNRFDPGMAYVGLANIMWAPVHAKLKMGGGIVHSDIMFFAGAGRMFHDAVQGVAFDAGIALDMFVTKFMTIRIDLRDIAAVQEIAAETRFTNNIVATLGLAIWIPSGL
jgi:outer membrane beta-barrel protein